MQKQDLVGIEEAARKLGSTVVNALMQVKRGLLKGIEVDGVWLIDRGSLEALLEQTGDRKADNICRCSPSCSGCG